MIKSATMRWGFIDPQASIKLEAYNKRPLFKNVVSKKEEAAADLVSLFHGNIIFIIWL